METTSNLSPTYFGEAACGRDNISARMAKPTETVRATKNRNSLRAFMRLKFSGMIGNPYAV
jgi:hypothetical protein